MNGDALLPAERKILDELGHLPLDFRAMWAISNVSKSGRADASRWRSCASARLRRIASRNWLAPWARNASQSFKARSGREYSSVMSAAWSSCRWCGR